MPVAAVTPRGRPTVSAGSSTAQSAVSGRAFTASFTPPSQVITEIGVASEPVPAVVGTSTSGSRSALRDVDAPDLVQIVAGAEQIGGELGHIHRASAAEADDGPRRQPSAPPRPRLPASSATDRLRPDRIWSTVRPAASSAWRQASVRPSRDQLLVRHEQARARRQQVRDRFRLAGAGDQPRSGMEGEAAHRAQTSVGQPRFPPRPRSSRPISARAGLATGSSVTTPSSMRLIRA